MAGYDYDLKYLSCIVNTLYCISCSSIMHISVSSIVEYACFPVDLAAWHGSIAAAEADLHILIIH